MSLLVETIRIENGNLLNISFHNERMIRSLYMIYGLRSNCRLEEMIKIPDMASTGIFKCRVIYDDRSVQIEFLPYSIRKVNSLKLVNGNDICYPYKYTDRTKINRLFEMRGECDDIIIVKNGMITDSTYANLLFRHSNGDWITPANFLLPGTRRAGLLQNGLIREAEISKGDSGKYTGVKLINSMIGIDDAEIIPISGIIF